VQYTWRTTIIFPRPTARLEPQLMMLGEAAGLATCMALGGGGGGAKPIQRIDVGELQKALRTQRPFPAILHESETVEDSESTHC
jgi:hypothetical protein